ncbi:MAG: FAD-binding protein [Deltaproteobacteria bacterium]|nr:FAD-binding protein [Deltaproteobacteria bacterium]
MKITNKIFKEIEKIVGGKNLSIDKEDLYCYSYDSTAKTFVPDLVVFPQSEEDVSEIMKIASKEMIPVVPRGSGSGATGGSLPIEGGIAMVMTRMNKINVIDTDNLIAKVEPGVVTGNFQREVEKYGLFYPPDPSSADFSTLGGNLAECAGGPKAVKYGVTRDYVLGVSFVLPDGKIIKTGVETAKGVVGYDLTKLIVGSEGTLGIITGITLKLLPAPETVKTMMAIFNSMEKAAETISEIIRNGLVPRAIEYMDNASIVCAENYIKAGLPVEAEAILILEVDGTETSTQREIKELKEMCIKNSATVKVAKTSSETKDLWKARKAISPSLFMYAPHKINEDIVVPRSKIPLMVKKIKELKEKTGLTMVSFGHAGDGNIHFNIMLDKNNREEFEKAEKAVDEMFDYTLFLNGTISGEHGIGITKQKYISKEIGKDETFLMKSIKKTFDPKNILNPGKIFELDGD